MFGVLDFAAMGDGQIELLLRMIDQAFDRKSSLRQAAKTRASIFGSWPGAHPPTVRKRKSSLVDLSSYLHQSRQAMSAKEEVATPSRETPSRETNHSEAFAFCRVRQFVVGAYEDSPRGWLLHQIKAALSCSASAARSWWLLNRRSARCLTSSVG